MTHGRDAVTRRSKLTWTVLALLAMVGFIAAWPMYKMLTVRAVNAALMERTKKAVETHPELQPDWDRAMEDGVLTLPEASAILEKAGEKVEP
jgi:hypothetical protein